MEVEVGYHQGEGGGGVVVLDVPPLILFENLCKGNACNSGLHGTLNLRERGFAKGAVYKYP